MDDLISVDIHLLFQPRCPGFPVTGTATADGASGPGGTENFPLTLKSPRFGTME